MLNTKKSISTYTFSLSMAAERLGLVGNEWNYNIVKVDLFRTIYDFVIRLCSIVHKRGL